MYCLFNCWETFDKKSCILAELLLYFGDRQTHCLFLRIPTGLNMVFPLSLWCPRWSRLFIFTIYFCIVCMLIHKTIIRDRLKIIFQDWTTSVDMDLELKFLWNPGQPTLSDIPFISCCLCIVLRCIKYKMVFPFIYLVLRLSYLLQNLVGKVVVVLLCHLVHVLYVHIFINNK